MDFNKKVSLFGETFFNTYYRCVFNSFIASCV